MSVLRNLQKAVDERARLFGYNPRPMRRTSEKGTFAPIDRETAERLRRALMKRITG